MKKLLNTITFLVLLVALFPGQMQGQVQFGLKAGLNFNNSAFSGLADGFESHKTTGFLVGPVLDIPIPFTAMSIETAVLYSQRKLNFSFEADYMYGEIPIKISESGMKSTQHALEIPVNLKYSVGLEGLATLFILAGPDFIINLSSNNILDELYRVTNMENKHGNPVKALELGFNVGLGVKLLDKFQVSADYLIPLTNSVKTTIDSWHGTQPVAVNTIKIKNRTWQLAVAYFF